MNYSISKTCDKFLPPLRAGIIDQISSLSLIFFRICFFSVIIFLFDQVFDSVNAGPERLWYLTMTQLIVLATAPLAFRIAQDIQSSQFANFLLLPVNYTHFRFFESLGMSLVRYISLGGAGLLLAFLLAQAFPFTLFKLVTGALLGFLGIILNTQIFMLIGLVSFWLKDIKNIFYLNLTATFCFGGLIVPLEFFPKAFKMISFCTPYPWILYLPSQWLTGSMDILPALLGWSLWSLIFGLAINLTYKRCLKSFTAGN